LHHRVEPALEPVQEPVLAREQAPVREQVRALQPESVDLQASSESASAVPPILVVVPEPQFR
jgi:hypothetical protein